LQNRFCAIGEARSVVIKSMPRDPMDSLQLGMDCIKCLPIGLLAVHSEAGEARINMDRDFRGHNQAGIRYFIRAHSWAILSTFCPPPEPE